jgi:biopolymer transport protein ExbB
MFHLALFENTYQFFLKGGVFMGLLLACSFVALTVIILRALALRRRAVIPPLVEREINNLKVGESPEHLRRLAQDDESALARIVTVAVRPTAGTKPETMEVVQSRARQEIVHLESGLFILEIVVGIAPLLGLLGAVSGLVRVFGNIG